MLKLDNQWFEHATGNVASFFCLGQGGRWRLLSSRAKINTHLWVVVKVVNLTVGTHINGVFVDMHATDAIKGVVGIEKGE